MNHNHTEWIFGLLKAYIKGTYSPQVTLSYSFKYHRPSISLDCSVSAFLLHAFVIAMKVNKLIYLPFSVFFVCVHPTWPLFVVFFVLFIFLTFCLPLFVVLSISL